MLGRGRSDISIAFLGFWVISRRHFFQITQNFIRNLTKEKVFCFWSIFGVIKGKPEVTTKLSRIELLQMENIYKLQICFGIPLLILAKQ